MTEDNDKAEEAEAEGAEDADADEVEASSEPDSEPDRDPDPVPAEEGPAPPITLLPVGDVFVLTLASLGIYGVVWRYYRRQELAASGGQLPMKWLAFVPLLGPVLLQAVVNRHYAHAMPPARKGPPKGWVLAANLVLPLQLTAGAVAIHWALNVPDEIIVSPRDQGAKKKKKKKPRANDRRAQRGNSKKLERKPRSENTLDRTLARWSRRKFEDEPVVVEWARRHQTLVSKAFIEARRAAFDGAPEEPAIALASTACKTVRCRFVLRSPFSHELDAVAASLRRIEADGESVWRMFESENIEAPEGEPPEERYLQLTIAWQTDEIEPAAIEVGPLEPATESGGEAAEPEDAPEPKPAGHAAAG